MRELIKNPLGHLVAGFNGQCRFDRAIFVLAHMRSGSTALSNVLCSRPNVSGYGEAHIRYNGRSALGKLLINQARRKAWGYGTSWLFDKILHSRYDQGAPEEFFQAKAIFLAREPGPSVRSIRKLFVETGKREYQTDAVAADYYEERLAALTALWPRFPAANRVGLTHAMLMDDPERALARIAAMIELDSPLRNDYRSHPASRTGGGGDPTLSGRLQRIERQDRSGQGVPPLAISAAQADRLEVAYAAFQVMIAEEEKTA